MAVRVGSGIVKDGLILHLDVADTLNYLLSTVEVLVVAGGGGGGVCYGGGGGGGGVLYNNAYPVTPGSGITVTVGGGGTRQVNTSGNGGNGSNSVFGNMTALGGGYGGGNCGNAGGSGGSGGGGSSNGSSRTAGGSGTPVQGRDGEYSIVAGGGGGGGAGAAGFQRSGGDGLPFNISGSVKYYAGGGTAGGSGDLPGGKGGGGMGGTAVTTDRANGTNGLGGGGGGSIISGSTGVSGLGGSGTVIVRYPGPQKASGGDTITESGGYTIHTFTTVGSTTFTPYSSVNSITGLFDLTGNNNHALGGTTPSYNSANTGSLVFNGSTQYLRSRTNPNNLRNLQGLSLFIWCRSTSSSPARRYVFDGRGNKIVSEAAPGVGMGFDAGYSDNKIFHFITGTDSTYTEATSPTTFLNNQIYQLGIVRQPYSSTFQVLDTDSRTLITPSFTAPRMTASATVDIGEYVLGTFASSTAGAGQNYWWNGNVYCVLAYNRALTQTEINQNFNALRGRYGL